MSGVLSQMTESEIIYTKEQYEEYYSERFIYGEELLKIIDIMKNNSNYRILILGAPGSGKSTLLRWFRRNTKSQCVIALY